MKPNQGEICFSQSEPGEATGSSGFPQLWRCSHSVYPDRLREVIVQIFFGMASKINLEHFGGGREHVIA